MRACGTDASRHDLVRWHRGCSRPALFIALDGGAVSFLVELRQRKVFRVAAAYLLVAWVAIQAASIALPAFDAPAWTLRVVILLFALGLPLTLLLAWALELTPEGLKFDTGKVGSRRMLAVTTALTILAVAWYVIGEQALRNDPRYRKILAPARIKTAAQLSAARAASLL
jgi:hypothetical protein